MSLRPVQSSSMDAISKPEQLCGRKITVLMGLRVAQVGCIAARGLREGAGGTVTAVFDRSFYLTLGEQWVCIGSPDLGAGPVNAICNPWPIIGPVSKLVDLHAFVIWHGRTLRVGPSLMISFAQVQPWSPPPPEPWNQITF